MTAPQADPDFPPPPPESGLTVDQLIRADGAWRRVAPARFITLLRAEDSDAGTP